MKQFILIIDGPMGSGKTTIGALVHKKLKRTAWLSTDKIKWFISDFERNERDKNITAKVLMAMCVAYLDEGISIILPQGFWKKEFIEPYKKLAKKKNIPICIYQLEAPRAVLLERLKNRPTPKIAKKPVPKSRILSNLRTWEGNKYAADTVFDTSVLTPEVVAKLILKDLKGML